VSSLPIVDTVDYPNVMVGSAEFNTASCSLLFSVVGGDVPPSSGTDIVLGNLPCLPSQVSVDGNTDVVKFGTGPGPAQVSLLGPPPSSESFQHYVVTVPSACVAACTV
jgi:hypothetical protein